MIEHRCSRCGVLVMTEEDGQEGVVDLRHGLCQDCEDDCSHRHEDDIYD